MKICIRVLLFIILISTFSCVNVDRTSDVNYWSKGGSVYSPNTFNAHLLWNVTYLSPEFRDYAREKISKLMKFKTTDYDVQPSYLETDEPGTFMCSVYVPRGAPLITSDSDNYWDLSLITADGVAIKPTSIETVTVTPREYKLFPAHHQWAKLYKVHFPVTFLDRPFTMALRSADATSELKWK